MSWHPYIIDTPRKFVCRPFLFAILFREIKFANRVAVESSLVSFKNSVMTIYPHCCVVMRDREGKESRSISFSRFTSLNNSTVALCNSCAVGILLICDIQCRCTTHVNNGEVHVVRRHEIGSLRELAYKRLDLFELVICERRSPESHRIVRLRTGISHWDGIIPAFIRTFDQAHKLGSAVCGQSFRRRRN